MRLYRRCGRVGGRGCHAEVCSRSAHGVLLRDESTRPRTPHTRLSTSSAGSGACGPVGTGEARVHVHAATGRRGRSGCGSGQQGPQPRLQSRARGLPHQPARPPAATELRAAVRPVVGLTARTGQPRGPHTGLARPMRASTRRASSATVDCNELATCAGNNARRKQRPCCVRSVMRAPQAIARGAHRHRCPGRRRVARAALLV